METRNNPHVSRALECLTSRVREVRAQRRLSLRVAAEQIGMGFAELSRFENGKLDPKLSTVQKIADWIDADLEPVSLDNLTEQACQAIYREFEGYWPAEFERARIRVAIKEVLS